MTDEPRPRYVRFQPPDEYTDGRTKQSYKDSVDVNRILDRAARAGGLSHLNQYGGQYADFSDFDFQDAQNRLAQGREIFAALPPELQREFGYDPSNFFDFATDPANVDRLAELFPQLARPGRQLPSVVGNPPGQGGNPPAPAGGPQQATESTTEPAP